MEKFLLNGFFLGNKLNVVDYQNVGVSVILAKSVALASAVRAVPEHGVYNIVEELVAGDVNYFKLRLVLYNLVAYRLD